MAQNKVVIRIHEARGLPAADFNGFSDPFVELRVKGDSASHKTKVMKDSNAPRWNEEFTLVPKNMETEFLSLKVYDQNKFLTNTLLGELEIPLALFLAKPMVEEWRQLQVRSSSNFNILNPGKGELKFSVYYVPSNAGYALPPQGVPSGYPPQQGFPPQGYPPQPQGYPPQGYPPQPQGYPPQPQGYPPQQGQPQQGQPPQYQAPPQSGYPPQPPGYTAPQPGQPVMPPPTAPHVEPGNLYPTLDIHQQASAPPPVSQAPPPYSQPSAADLGTPARIEILGAVYGRTGVTDRMRHFAQNIQPNQDFVIMADNQTWGDSWPGVQKTLACYWRYTSLDGRFFGLTKVFLSVEGTQMKIPAPASSGEILNNPPFMEPSRLKLYGAVYGKHDATTQVRALIMNHWIASGGGKSVLKIHANNQTFGDSFPGVPKSLSILGIDHKGQMFLHLLTEGAHIELKL